MTGKGADGGDAWTVAQVDRDWRHNLAHVHLAAGRTAEAIDLLKSVLAETRLGIALARTGQFDWAIRAFEVAVELAPSYAFAHRCLTHLYRRTKGDAAKARVHFERVVALRRERSKADA